MKSKFMKKASAVLASSAMFMSGIATIGMNMNIAYAATNIETEAVSGTINITGCPSNLKSFQIYNYNDYQIEYNGRTYRVGALIAIIPVGTDGTASISGLPVGVYRIKEYKTSSGYSINKTYYTVKITNDIPQEVVPDAPEVGTVGNIRLIGADNISLFGMEFQLKNVGASSIIYNDTVINVGEIVGTFVSSDDTLLIPELPYGVYELVQTGSTVGIYPDPNTYTINIINGDTIEITILVSNHQHRWDGGTVTVEPTCTESGILTFTCEICGEETTSVIPKLGHNYYTQNPTCQEDGYRMCTRCDEMMVLPKTGHDWDEGVLSGSSSCGQNATRTYHCRYCGQEKVEALPRVQGHSYQTSLTQASPTQDGGIIKECTKCGAIDTDTIIAKIDRVELEYTETAHTGSALKPSVTVYDANGKKISSAYYTVNYYNNIKVGTASVTVSFKGNYTGQITENFMILPKGTSILSLTPLYHGFTVKWAMQSKEVTGYDLEYATKEDFSDAGILQTTKYTTLAKTVAGLKPNTKYYVRIRTYKGSSYSEWSPVKTVVTLQ